MAERVRECEQERKIEGGSMRERQKERVRERGGEEGEGGREGEGKFSRREADRKSEKSDMAESFLLPGSLPLASLCRWR